MNWLKVLWKRMFPKQPYVPNGFQAKKEMMDAIRKYDSKRRW